MSEDTMWVMIDVQDLTALVEQLNVQIAETQELREQRDAEVEVHRAHLRKIIVVEGNAENITEAERTWRRMCVRRGLEDNCV